MASIVEGNIFYKSKVQISLVWKAIATKSSDLEIEKEDTLWFLSPFHFLYNIKVAESLTWTPFSSNTHKENFPYSEQTIKPAENDSIHLMAKFFSLKAFYIY